MRARAGVRATGQDVDELAAAPARTPEPRVTVTPPGPPADRGGSPEPPPALTEREEHILAFERRWWRRAGSKEQAIRDQLGLSATRYYQLLNRLLDNPAALAFDPILVKRLRRIRAARTRVRRGSSASR